MNTYYEYQAPTMTEDEQARTLIGMVLASHNYRRTLDPTDVTIAMPKNLGNGDLSGLLGMSIALTLDIITAAGGDPEEVLLSISNRLLERGV